MHRGRDELMILRQSGLAPKKGEGVKQDMTKMEEDLGQYLSTPDNSDGILMVNQRFRETRG